MIEELIIKFSYLIIILFLFINGIIGIPSSQIVYIILGWLIYKNYFPSTITIIISITSHIAGNLFLYEISRKKGKKICQKLNQTFLKIYNKEILSNKNLLKMQKILKERPTIYLFLGKLINPIKLIINIPSGITKLERKIFYPIIILTSTIWGLTFISIGYYIGKEIKFGIIYGIIMISLSGIIIYHFKKEFEKTNL